MYGRRRNSRHSRITRTLPHRTWLDIGAGTTKGISELSKGPLGEGFSAIATILNKSESVESFLGSERTYVTPVEMLDGIADSLISLATGLNSVAYSKVPDRAVESIDRVLEPGGIYQGTFQDPEKAHSAVPMNPYDEFKTEFDKRGYDTAVAINPDPKTGVYILIAVKQGASISAQTLLEANLKSLPQPPTEQQRIIEETESRGYGLALDLLPTDATPEAIEEFVKDELIGNRGFSPEAAEAVRQRLLIR